jgi:predicted HTH transcriptional regulator
LDRRKTLKEIICSCSVMAITSDFPSEDEGSIPFGSTKNNMEKNKNSKPLPPQPPLSRIIGEGDSEICEKCGSGIKKTFFLKKLGCRQPKCKNYYGKKQK